ncbi:MAG: hypothetical protein EGR49_08825 [Prevotella sp.]|nr:hypothetical protein [Prevotella sp.]
MLTKACCKGNNYEQRFALDTFPADFSWRNVLAKPCILLFTLQQDCNMREACRFHFMVPFLAMAKLERARFCAWLIESVVTCCKSCICCFSPISRLRFLLAHFKPLGRWRVLRQDKAIDRKQGQEQKQEQEQNNSNYTRTRWI